MSVPADVQNENAGDGSANWGPVSVNQSQQQKSEIEAQQRSESIRLRAENLRLEAENEVLRRELAIRQAEKEKLLIDNARLKRALSSLLAGPEEWVCNQLSFFQMQNGGWYDFLSISWLSGAIC